MFYHFARSFKPQSVGVFCLALLQASAFATNVIDLQTFELGSNVTLTCGNSNLSSATVLSWSKDERLLVNITSNNSTLVLSNLTANGSGLYVCSANSSIILRRVRLAITTRGTVPEQEEEFIPDERLTKIDIIAIVIGLGLTTFLVVSIALLLYRAQKRLNEAKYMNRWKISVKRQENMTVEEEFIKRPLPGSAFYITTIPDRPPPAYRKPMHFMKDNYGIKYEADENANNSEGILQWRFTAYL